MPARRGKVAVTPRLVLPAVRCDGAICADTPAASTTFPLAELAAHVAVPVQRKVHNTELLQVTAPEWERQLVLDRVEDHPCFHPPVLLSARTGWYLHERSVEVFDRALVLDGARRLEAALRAGAPNAVPTLVLFGLDAAAEHALRQRLDDRRAAAPRIETQERVDTTTPRLIIGENWVNAEIQSDPFVVPTTRGYAPAILVRRATAAQLEHVLIGAKSLAERIEAVRVQRATLVGVWVSIRKQAADRTAPYSLHVREPQAGLGLQ